MSRYKNRGEIATVLTLISMGLMLMGVVVGNVAVQQTTKTQSRAGEDVCTDTSRLVFSSLQECIDNGERAYRCKPESCKYCQDDTRAACTVNPNPPPPPATCASGWVCRNQCADQAAVDLFNGTWCDGKARWLWEAARNNNSCGGNPSIPKNDPKCSSAPPPAKGEEGGSCSTNQPCKSSDLVCSDQDWSKPFYPGTCKKSTAPPPAGDLECMAYASPTDCKNQTGCSESCVSCTILGGGNGYKCPSTPPPDGTDTSCSPNKIDVTGKCNFACCGTNSDCPEGEECGIPNGYCKNSGKSCAPKAKGQSTPLYVRMCGGASCTWTFCDGLNTDIDKNCIPKAKVDELLALPRPVTKNDKGILCLSHEECKSFVPTAATGVNKCRLTGQATFAEAKRVDCPVTYKQCYSEGKSVLVHRDCTQSNESRCMYWCESKDGKRTGCGPADGPDAKTFDDPSCDGDKGKTETQTCYPFKCPDNSGKEFSVKNRQLFDSSDCSGNPVISYSSICGGSIGDGCDLVSGGNGKGKCVADASQCTGSGYTGRAYPRWGPSNNDVDIPLCSAQNKNLCCEPNTGPKGGFTPNPLTPIERPSASQPPGTVTVGDADKNCQITLPKSIKVNEPFEASVKSREVTSVHLNFKRSDSSSPVTFGSPNVIFHLLDDTTTTNRPAKADCETNPVPSKCFEYVTWKYSNRKLDTAGTYEVSFKYQGGECSTKPKITVNLASAASTGTTITSCKQINKKLSSEPVEQCFETSLKRKLGSNYSSDSQCSLSQNILFNCSKSGCGGAWADCAAISNSDDANAVLYPASFVNEEYTSVIAAINTRKLNAIQASLYVLNATRVPGLQRLYCDPFKGQCDFYYQQQVGT